MELGKRLKQARLEAGLSQRQLCGDEITRNMLSQIENGAARPSMDTLRYLAGQLGKTISYFLEEETVTSPNQPVMEAARHAYLSADYAAALKSLEHYREPDGIFDQERRLLEVLSCLSLAEEALVRGRRPYAGELLNRAAEAGRDLAYCRRELERRRLLLAVQVTPQMRRESVCALPPLDAELLIRARDALDNGNVSRCAALLDAAEDWEAADWNFLRGEAYLARQAYRQAAACYHKAEAQFPEKTALRLERCYRELEDYKMAYEYACRQRKA
ncbi:MAG: helix-turn-helix transcriptional regulator [Oscillospiraceae bacterium]|nr:helix-turn-helix transcriptional regulator [Oscillospiraceae bacterium]